MSKFYNLTRCNTLKYINFYVPLHKIRVCIVPTNCLLLVHNKIIEL